MIVWMRAATLSRVREEAQRRFPLETGGVLVGYWSKDYRAVLISDASGPGPTAEHGATNFAPDVAFQRAYVGDRYAESGRVCTYLGDWHSHPNGGDSLSRTDIATLRRIATDKKARARTPLMAILSGEDAAWSLTVWVLTSPGWLLRPRAQITRAVVRINNTRG